MTPGALDDPNDELLFRYIAGACSPAEHFSVVSWLRRDPANERHAEAIRRIWLASRPSPSRDVDRMWARLRRAVERDPVRGASITRLSAPSFPAARFATTLVALAAAAALLVTLSRSKPAVVLQSSAHVYATGPAQTANVRLRDGSTVMLAPDSRLRVPDDFGDRERLVSIDGQGFFAVVHNDSIPFRVRAKNAITEDIGTRFDLRAYRNEVGVVVIVAEGAVTLGHVGGDNSRHGAEGVVVRRGERARTGGPDSATMVDHVPLSLVDWTDGRLSFVKTPLAEVARTIGRWYDLDVRVADAALRPRLITADFNTQSPTEMVEELATATGGEVQQHGRVLTIQLKP